MITVVAPANAAEINIDGLIDEGRGIRYLGKASRGADGRWTGLAVLGGELLCRVELIVSPTIHVDHDRGDEDDRALKDAACSP